MGAEYSRLRIKFEEDNILMVQISARSTVHDATIQAVQMYNQTTGKDVSVRGLKASRPMVCEQRSCRMINLLVFFRVLKVASWLMT